MPYYHNSAERKLYHLPDNPRVSRTTHKGRPFEYVISATIEITYADNPFDPQTRRLTKPETESAKVNLLQEHYTEEEALKEFFLRFAPRDAEEIPAEEYRRLLKEYTGSTSA